jgi:DNA-directed RNA polymerase subunit F
MSRKILSEKPVSLERVKELLKFRGEKADLNYIQRVTFEYAHKFSKHFPNSEEMLDTLNERYEISREKGIQLINMNPKYPEELTLVLEDKFPKDKAIEIIELFKEHLSMFQVEMGEEDVKEDYNDIGLEDGEDTDTTSEDSTD